MAEVGYDLSYEKAVDPTAVGVPVHSGRLFVAETISLNPATGATVGVEVLTNLNQEKAPADGYVEVDAFKDTRVIAKLGITTTLWKNISFGFGFTAKYDHAPAPLPAPKAAGGMPLPFAMDYKPLAEELDTLTEATLIVTFF